MDDIFTRVGNRRRVFFPASPSSIASKVGISDAPTTTTIGAGHSQVRYPSVSRSAALFARNSRSETAFDSQPCESGAFFYDNLWS